MCTSCTCILAAISKKALFFNQNTAKESDSFDSFYLVPSTFIQQINM